MNFLLYIESNKQVKYMVNFYIVRHGQTLLNYLNRAQGWIDSPLTDAGKQVAVDLGGKLKGITFDAVYTSDMKRAIQTAEYILSVRYKIGLQIQTDTRLREWCLGNMEAEDNTVFINKIADCVGVSSYEELNKRLPDVATTIHEHDTTGMTESFSDIVIRLKSIFMEIVQKGNTKENTYNVLVVTHAFSIKTLFYLFAPKQLSIIGKIKNAGISRLKFDGNIFSLETDIKI